MESMMLIYVCSTISAIGTLLFRSSQSAFIMQFVSKEDRPLATSMRQMASSVLALIGAGIATFFYKMWGAGASLSIAAMLFVVVLPILASIKVEYTALPPKESGQKLRSILDDFRSGFHYCWNHRTVRPMLLALLMFGINAGVSNVLMIFALTEFFKLPKETLAYTAPLEGITMFLVALMLPKLKYRQENMVAYSVMMLGIGTAVLVFTHIIAIGLIGVVIVVSGVVAFNNSTNTLSQTTTAFEYQGRLNMIFQAAWMAPMVILMVTAGWLHSLFSIQAILLTTGAVITVCGVLLYRVYHRLGAAEQSAVGHDQVAKA
jgi:hypothetical protein